MDNKDTMEKIDLIIRSETKKVRKELGIEGDEYPTLTDLQEVAAPDHPLAKLTVEMIPLDELPKELDALTNISVSTIISVRAYLWVSTAETPTPDNFAKMHQMWAAVPKDVRPPHPINTVIAVWVEEQTAKPMTKERDRLRPFAIIKTPGVVHEFTTEGDGDVGSVFESPQRSEQLQLVAFDSPSVLPPIMPLQGVSTTRDGRLSHETRIFYESMFALQGRTHEVKLTFRLGDLIDYLYPNTVESDDNPKPQKFRWGQQYPLIKRAIYNLHTGLTVPWIDEAGLVHQWRPVVARNVLPDTATRDTMIHLRAEMPPDAKQGYLVGKVPHRRLGFESAARWNAYHIACWLWDEKGTRGGKITRSTKPLENRNAAGELMTDKDIVIYDQRGRPIKNIRHAGAIRQLPRVRHYEGIKKYPILSTEDLILACFPQGYPQGYRAGYLKRAKAHWTALEQAGYVVIVEEGRAGWRILPPDEHCRGYKGVQEAAKLAREGH